MSRGFWSTELELERGAGARSCEEKLGIGGVAVAGAACVVVAAFVCKDTGFLRFRIMVVVDLAYRW